VFLLILCTLLCLHFFPFLIFFVNTFLIFALGYLGSGPVDTYLLLIWYSYKRRPKNVFLWSDCAIITNSKVTGTGKEKKEKRFEKDATRKSEDGKMKRKRKENKRDGLLEWLEVAAQPRKSYIITTPK